MSGITFNPIIPFVSPAFAQDTVETPRVASKRESDIFWGGTGETVAKVVRDTSLVVVASMATTFLAAGAPVTFPVVAGAIAITALVGSAEYMLTEATRQYCVDGKVLSDSNQIYKMVCEGLLGGITGAACGLGGSGVAGVFSKSLRYGGKWVVPMFLDGVIGGGVPLAAETKLHGGSWGDAAVSFIEGAAIGGVTAGIGGKVLEKIFRRPQTQFAQRLIKGSQVLNQSGGKEAQKIIGRLEKDLRSSSNIFDSIDLRVNKMLIQNPSGEGTYSSFDGIEYVLRSGEVTIHGFFHVAPDGQIYPILQNLHARTRNQGGKGIQFVRDAFTWMHKEFGAKHVIIGYISDKGYKIWPEMGLEILGPKDLRYFDLVQKLPFAADEKTVRTIYGRVLGDVVERDWSTLSLGTHAHALNLAQKIRTGNLRPCQIAKRYLPILKKAVASLSEAKPHDNLLERVFEDEAKRLGHDALIFHGIIDLEKLVS